MTGPGLGPAPETPILATVVDDGLATLTMSAPPVNALSLMLLDELVEQTRALATNPDLRVVVLRSAVPGMWMAGADLKDTTQRFGNVAQTQRAISEAFRAWEQLPLPTIAQIEGHCLGGGCELALCCDFRIMSRGRASIGLPESRLALLPAAGGTQRLSRIVGRAHALDIVLRGRRLGADEAERIGLVTLSAPAEELARKVAELVNELRQLSPLAVAAAKRCVIGGESLTLDAGLALEGLEMVRLAGSSDAREGIRAFLEKRPARFTGQ